MDEQQRRPWRGLEIALFAVVFSAGGALAGLALFGESGVETAPPPATPFPGPVAAPSPVAPVVPPEGEIPGIAAGGPQVLTTNARADIEPSGCRAEITFLWEIDPATAPPGELRAVIEVDGPEKAGEYRKRVVGDEVRLVLDVAVTQASQWTADLVTVGGRDVFPTPLPVSFTDAFC